MRLTEHQLDVLTELFNIGVGRGASVLNTMLQSHIRLSVPFIRMVSRDRIAAEIGQLEEKHLSTVGLKFDGRFSGKTQLIFTKKTAAALVSALVADPTPEMDMDAIKEGTLKEVGNIVLNSVMGSIGNVLKIHFSYSVPGYVELTPEKLVHFFDKNADVAIMVARTRFLVEKLEMDGDIVLFLEVGAFGRLLEAINFLSHNLRESP